MRFFHLAAVLTAVLLFSGCATGSRLRIRRTRDNQEIGAYHIKSFTGVRDGDKLKSQLVLADKEDALTMLLNFQVGVPTKLESGVYQWTRKDVKDALKGTIKADAVTFLGGQDTPASIGGTFELVGENVDIALYQIHLPTTRMEAAGQTPFSLP